MSNAEKKVQDDAALLVQNTYGGQLYRNNVGVAFDQKTKTPVRFGLANTSAKENRSYKSSDQIGIVPVVITPEMVGKTIGVFAAFEDKRPGWVLRQSDKHGMAQSAFLEHIKQMGGLAGFITHADHVHYHIQEFTQCLKK